MPNQMPPPEAPEAEVESLESLSQKISADLTSLMGMVGEEEQAKLQQCMEIISSMGGEAPAPKQDKSTVSDMGGVGGVPV